MRFIYFAIFLLLPVLASAQKVELEQRVPETKLPAGMLEMLSENYPGHKRMRYYEEQNEDGRFFEAKFCYRQSHYSVKFDTLGGLVDVERKIRFRDIPPETAGRIRESLQEYFQRYTIRKVQERLDGEQVIGYELELQGKSARTLGYFEAQYDARGENERVRTVDRKPNDFIFF